MAKKLDFLNLGYKPKKSDLVCLFRIEPARGSVKEAANTVALESSIGTWTPVGSNKNYVNRLAAKVFSVKGKWAKIAYPIDLFEPGNAPNILSSIAGNIFGMKAVNGLRLEDIYIPPAMLRSFKGPKYGMKGVRDMLGVKKRPLVGTIVKPKLGLRTEDHAQVAYDAWKGGCDVVKDDENLSSQKFNPYRKRLKMTLKKMEKAEKETGEKKTYLVNVTAETNEMIKRAKMAQDTGARHVMVDIVTAGFSGLQTLRDANLKLGIHAHRAMHGAFTRNKEHGISMMVLADFARLIGVDQLHIGTVVGKMEGGAEEVQELTEEMEEKEVKATRIRLAQNWGKIKPVFAVSSGGLHPGHIPYLIKHLGKDIIIQMGGGIHGNKLGTLKGSMAARQAVDASMKGISLKKYAKDYPELDSTIGQWGCL